MKTCSRCKVEKPYTDFGKSSKAPDGYQWHCRQCKAELHQLNRASRMKSINASKASRVDRNRAWGVQWLLAHPCACGERQPRYLQWDHDDPATKKAAVSDLILAGYSIKTLEAEAAKCTVRCVKCHRDRTIKQYNHWIGSQAFVFAETAKAHASVYPLTSNQEKG